MSDGSEMVGEALASAFLDGVSDPTPADLSVGGESADGDVELKVEFDGTVVSVTLTHEEAEELGGKLIRAAE